MKPRAEGLVGRRAGGSADRTVEHLGMIQAVVARMAGMSTFLKGSALSVAAAAGALPLASDSIDGNVSAVALVPIAVLWLMDSKYHQQERWFRDMYDFARKGRVSDFAITPSEGIRRRRRLHSSLFSWATLPFYVALAAVILVAWRFST